MSDAAARSTEIETSDLDTMRAFLSEAIADCRLVCRRSQKPRARLARYRVGGIDLAHVTYDAGVRVDAVCPPDTYVAETWLAGTGIASTDEPRRAYDARPGTIVLRWPESSIHTELSPHASVLVMRLPPALGDEFSSAIGRAHAGVALGHRLEPTAVRFFSWLLDEARGGGSVWSADRLGSDLERVVAGVLYRPGGGGGGRAGHPLPSFLRAALAAAQREVVPTVNDLARAAGVSTRTLQAGFRRWIDATPSGWLRDIRLDRAHARLRTAGPHDTTVTEVALDHGFSHLGRFAAQYRQRFGEPPSVTLQRMG